MLIAQLSDLHINPNGDPAYGRADTLLNLRLTLEAVKGYHPDMIVITGDISDRGEEGAYRLCKSLLDEAGLPYIPLPGNHDHRPTLARVFEDRDNPLSGPGHLCRVIAEDPLLLIGLDTVLAGEHGGGLDQERLDWLDAVLSSHPHTPACLFMHHPPFLAAIPHMDTEPFKNRELFQKLIQRHSQVIRICCGHVHRPITLGFDHTIAMVCPAVGMQIPLDFSPKAPSAFNTEPPAFMLHTYTPGWDNTPALISHVKPVELQPGQFEQTFAFFDVASPD